MEGFFPFCEPESRPQTGPRTGIQETGLAYEADPAVTRHLAQFLSRQEDRPRELPTAVLFNGGVMKAPLLQRRVTEVLASWQNDAELRVLESSNMDLAVASGAAYYGLARRGRGVRIRSGLNKSYYIGVAASLPAVPGMPAPIKALCVAPFGMEEGSSTELTEREFNLIVGEPAKFDFLGSSVRTGDTVGALIEDWESDIEPITTIETTLDGTYGSVIPVSIQVKLTEIGTLELWCVSRQDGKPLETRIQRAGKSMTSDMEDRRFIIGIDLGTTNCAAAYVDLQEKKPAGKGHPDFQNSSAHRTRPSEPPAASAFLSVHSR